MSKLEFTAAVIGSVMWPLVAVVALVMFRRSLRNAADALVSKASGQVEFMNLRVAWQAQMSQVEAEVERVAELQTDEGPAPELPVLRDPVDEWLGCMQARTSIWLDLRRALDFKGISNSAREPLEEISAKSHDAGVITLEMHQAVSNCSRLFDLLIGEFAAGSTVYQVARFVHQLTPQMERMQTVIASVVSRLVTESGEIDPRP